MSLYVITAKNQLTDEREAITAPRSFNESHRLFQRWMEMTKDCQEPAWTDLKVERFRDNNG